MSRRRHERAHIILPRKQVFTPASYLSSMLLLSPKEIYQRLEELGYQGQEDARRSVCLCAYRHMKRLKSIHTQRISRNKLPPRSNAILIGPTGCGKSYIIELLFGEILKLPYAIVEMTRYTEAGYVGDDVSNILNLLVDAAHGNHELAECGIVALDEFDKIAGRDSILRFAGGSTKDVSGYGVQRELLKMIEGADVQFTKGYGPINFGHREIISTRDITFFGLGTFTGFTATDFNINIGFMQRIKKQADKREIAYSLNAEEADDIDRFQTYGFIPELIARFDRILPFQPLDACILKRILDDKIQRNKIEFKEEGFELHVDNGVCDLFVEEALKKKTGARGLDSAIIKHIEDIGFEYFGQNKTGTVILKLKKGQLKSEVRLSA